jgi:hypothetical protein
MNDNYQCERCSQKFSSSQRLQSHLKRKTPCQSVIKKKFTITQLKQERPQSASLRVYDSPPHCYQEKRGVLEVSNNFIVCQYCGQNFARTFCLERHLKDKRCKVLKKEFNQSSVELEEKMIILEQQLAEKDKEIVKLKENPTSQFEKLEKQIAELKEATTRTITEIAGLKETTIELKKEPRVNNQILQVVCIGNNDNYLDILTEKWKDFNKALEYIQNCALSSLSGDCQLIEKIYSTTNENPEISMKFLDKNRTRIEYFNENREKVSENKEIFGRKLANNLQNSYLKGVNYLINRNLDNKLCPNKLLEEYDLQIWNQHIYDLSDVRYHRKIINQLNIPTKT